MKARSGTISSPSRRLERLTITPPPPPDHLDLFGMPPRQQRSLQQHSSSSVAADLFPVYRPPAAGPSSATTAAFQSRHRSPSPDHPGRLERFIIKAHEADLVTGQPEIAHQLEQKRGAGESKQGRLVQCASSLSTGADDSDENAGVWVDRSVSA